MKKHPSSWDVAGQQVHGFDRRLHLASLKVPILMNNVFENGSPQQFVRQRWSRKEPMKNTLRRLTNWGPHEIVIQRVVSRKADALYYWTLLCRLPCWRDGNAVETW